MILLLVAIIVSVGCAKAHTYHDWRTGEHWCEVSEPDGHIHRYSWRQGEACESIRW